MGFLRPKTIVMPAAAAEPPKQVTPPPATIEDTYTNEAGQETSASAEAAKKIAKKKTGYTQTILTGPQGVTEEADIYTKSLLS
jgi:hypothetical protein